jgi:hypothetical protein
MPKKRNFNFKQLQGSSSSSKPVAPHGDNNSPSVNQRLSELRKLEGKDAAEKKRILADSVNQRSVPLPPDVRKALGVPDSAPPRPEVGVRTRDRYRTPGPAPPKSWVARSTWTPVLALRSGRRSLKKHTNVKERIRPRHLFRFALLAGFDDAVDNEHPPSLAHLALKAIAESWDLFDQEDWPALAEVPLRLRLEIISYIGMYGTTIDIRDLEALLQGSEGIPHLDLACLIGHSYLTPKKLARLIDKSEQPIDDPQDSVLESWDAEGETSLSNLRPTSRFSSLSHLCLSHPGPGASWQDLLWLAKSIPQITHLSLAYWPRPTLTPNLATTTISSGSGPDVTAGGSHYYSDFDQDMAEPASLLRQLSGSLLCLQWLDLEGCQSWMKALESLADAPRGSSDPWAETATMPPVFISNWKKLAYIRCAQGWLPSVAGVEAAERRTGLNVDRIVYGGITKHLKESSGDVSQPLTQDMRDMEKKKARLWLEAEYHTTTALANVNLHRREQGCRPILIDYGWVRREVLNVVV